MTPPLTRPPLDAWERTRYARHIMLDEIGAEGQERLKAASVLCVGTGGLGSPLLLYLAASGIGRLGLVDFDVVDESNLQRQVIHGTAMVGRRKVASAKARVLDINPRCQVDVHEVVLSSRNALDILRDYDVIVDGTDNFPTRYLVNDASVLLGKPNIYGSIYRFEGQASVFNYRGGPHYRDLYPEPPPPGAVPSCAEGGVLGVLPGVIGTIQATETIKVLLGLGDTLSGRLLLYDALSMRFRELALARDSSAEPVTELIDYEQFCGVPVNPAPATAPSTSFARLTPREVQARMAAGWHPFVLDVRKHAEAEVVSFAWADLLRPHEQIEAGVHGGIPRDRPILVHCRSGGRSARAAEALVAAGFPDVTNLEGGIVGWAQDVDPDMPTY